MLIVNDSNSLIHVALYYQIKKSKRGGKSVVIIPDEQAQKMLEDVDKKQEVHVLNTRWKQIAWGEQNEILDRASVPVPMGEDGVDKVLNPYIYRDMRIKLALREWDLVSDDGRPVPLTPDAINHLPTQVVLELYKRYEESTRYSEDELKK